MIQSSPKISVLLADDHTIVRQGLRALLQAERDIEVVAEAENGKQAVELTKSLQPDVVVMDIAMPLLNGLAATRQISKLSPATNVLILSMYNDDEFVQQVIDAGAVGYLVKQTAATDLLHAIREVNRGNAFFSPSISRYFIENFRRVRKKETSRRGIDALSSRESEVLHLIAEGRPNKQIALELSISIKTVEKHRQQIMNKLGIHDVAGLTRFALAQGIIDRGYRPKY